MQVYEVYKQPDSGYRAVKRGFCWPGFFFPVIWALAVRLWFPAVLLLCAFVPLGVFTRHFFAENPIFTILISLLIQAVVGFNGNIWRARNLEDRGGRFIGAIQARGASEAVSRVAAVGGVVPKEFSATYKSDGLLAMPRSLQRIFAVISLTWMAAFRYRLFWVLALLLLGAVVGLPLLLKDDGTAEGFTQIVLTYTLSAVTGVLGICTLWLSCGTLARDIEECQIQMVAVKPIGRWQIWFGKWLGIVSLNAALLALSGLSIYGLLEWRARQLPADQQFRLKNEILVSRASLKETGIRARVEQEVDRRFRDRMSKATAKGADLQVVQKQIQDQVLSEVESVPPNGYRGWAINLGSAAESLHRKPLFLRIKYNSSDVTESGTLYGEFLLGVPQKTRLWRSEVMSLSPNSFHEFPVPPDLYDQEGTLTIFFHNMNDATMLFSLDDGLELLYREGSFELNFIRGLGVILCWMALLATIGLTAASFLSFPVAAFASLAMLVLVFSSGTITNVVQEGTVMGMNEENGVFGHSALDAVLVPMFRGILVVIDFAKQFSPIDALSTGRSITWSQLGSVALQLIVFLGGLIACFGIFVFQRRELATAQGSH